MHARAEHNFTLRVFIFSLSANTWKLIIQVLLGPAGQTAKAAGLPQCYTSVLFAKREKCKIIYITTKTVCACARAFPLSSPRRKYYSSSLDVRQHCSTKKRLRRKLLIFPASVLRARALFIFSRRESRGYNLSSRRKLLFPRAFNGGASFAYIFLLLSWCFLLSFFFVCLCYIFLHNLLLFSTAWCVWGDDI